MKIKIEGKYKNVGEVILLPKELIVELEEIYLLLSADYEGHEYTVEKGMKKLKELINQLYKIRSFTIKPISSKVEGVILTSKDVEKLSGDISQCQ